MEVGQQVRVCRLRDRVSEEVVKTLGKTGTVAGYKMTDGSGVGVLVKFDNFSTWFFADEVEPA